MDLIIGGAFQGKLDYARNAFGLREEEIVTCTPDSEPDWNARCLCRVEDYVLDCVRRGVSPEEKFRPDAVLVGRDIFCGVVPIDPEERAWREETGRSDSRLSRGADSVTRLFCGIPQKLK
ncbi:MAG: bifunctional adenosylcobinamide kinase/adenosylcobinamide-phosphate guanylyltransferase [Oscillospiraceae bacterium]|nr:bifunctional adenosylcobinamide kinase/adenosylcobinamide-phosphate guanylyltransferase [Oscillospiraceae bacterium]